MAEWKRHLSAFACKNLRLAQRAKRRQMLQATGYARPIETGSEDGRGNASVADTDFWVDPVTAATWTLDHVIQRPYNDREENAQSSVEYAPASSQYPCPHVATTPKMGTTGGTDRDVLNNDAHVTQQGINGTGTSTDEAPSYALPDPRTNTVDGTYIYEPNPILSTSSGFLRAATLGSNTADGVAVYSTPILQDSMTSGMICYNAAPFADPDTGVLRAATLGSNTADGTAVYPPFSQHQSMAEVTAGYDVAPFPTTDVDFLRAATLGSNTADGATAYFSLDQQTFQGISFGQDELFVNNGAFTK
ncbi:hypothetical protein F66182_5645 [Fusarium sp. NRRL 66182]|nr:hypothetical protein F66182_5645 [Fusarium sp. NRRL 66182]